LDDLNGDGVDEFAVGAPANDGRIVLLDGGTSVSPPRQLISGGAAAELGTDMTTGDINGDDRKELLATAPGDRALKVYEFSNGLFNETASITRPGKAPFGASIAAQVTDVNGDNKGDMLVTWPSSADDSGGTAFVSGRTLAVEQTFPGYSLPPALVMKSSHIDPLQLRGAILLGGVIPFPGSSTSGFGYEASIAGFWGCPTTFLEDAHPTSIYAGTDANNGQPPVLVGVLGCAVPGGDIVVTGQLAALAPALLLVGTQLNQTPFPSILGTYNRLVLSRQSVVEIASIFVPSSGIAHFPVRNLGDHFFDPDGEGSQPPVFRLLFQAIQFAQWNPGAHPGGGGIASSKGVWLTAIQQ